jgi:glycine oxidase
LLILNRMRRYDIAVIGAGVIGCSVARKLAGQGCQVVLIDRAAPGGESSHAAAGMLAPSAEAETPSPLFDLALLSRRLYPALAAELMAETGIDPQYRCEGTLRLLPPATDLDRLRDQLSWQRARSVRIEQLSAGQLREIEPQLAAGEASALLLADDHQIDNRLLMSALVRSCRMRGVEMQLGEPVLRSLSRSGAATGVEFGPVSSPRAITAGTVINASGAWAAQIAGEGIPAMPVRPVKGHMLALRASPGTLRHVIRAEEVYLVPRNDGRIIIGSTMEEAGFDKSVQAAPVAQLLNAAQRVCPALASAEFLEAWTGLRPATPDGLPIIGPLRNVGGPLALVSPMPHVRNYWTALGHFRNGILLSPITAEVVSEWLISGHPPANVSSFMDAFSPDRFLA